MTVHFQGSKASLGELQCMSKRGLSSVLNNSNKAFRMSTSQSIHSSHADQAQQWRRSSPVQSTIHKRQPLQIPQPQQLPQVPGSPRTRKAIENCYPGVHLPSHLSQNAKSPLANYVSMKWGFQPSYQTVKCVIQGKSQFRCVLPHLEYLLTKFAIH